MLNVPAGSGSRRIRSSQIESSRSVAQITNRTFTANSGTA